MEGATSEVTSDHCGHFVIFPVIEHGRDVRMVTQPTQHLRLPCGHRQPAWHDEVVGVDIEGHLTIQDSITCKIDPLARGRPQESLNLVSSVPQEVSWPRRRVHEGETA